MPYPPLTWLQRLLDFHGPITIDLCFDGTLFTRALRTLEQRGGGAAVGLGLLHHSRGGVGLVTWTLPGCHRLLFLTMRPARVAATSRFKVGYVDCMGCHRCVLTAK